MFHRQLGQGKFCGTNDVYRFLEVNNLIDGWDCIPDGSRLKSQWLNCKTFHDNSRHPRFKIYLIKNLIAKDLNN